MSYRIVARSHDASTGVAKSTAHEALEVVRDLCGSGYQLTAIIDDDGDKVDVEKLEQIARSEARTPH